MEIITPPAAVNEDLPIVQFCQDQALTVIEVGDYGTYPHTDDAIIEFENKVFCYVESWADRTVTDPTSGAIVRTDVYGTPVSWAAYEPVPITKPVRKSSDDRSYVALKHESTFSVARKLKDYGFTETDFAEHNNIKLGDLVPGKTYHLPLAAPKVEPSVQYQTDGFPQLMHITRTGGAQKWAFGNVKSLKDIISGSGIYPELKELTIVAMAKVKVGDELFGYYMDELAFGKYQTTGKVNYLIGFARGDLAVGPAPVAPIEDPSPAITQQIQETLASIEPEPAPPVAVKEQFKSNKQLWPAPDEALENPHAWKGTYEPFTDHFGRPFPAMFIVDLPDGQDEILVHDLSGKLPARKLRNNGHYLVAGTILKDGIEYGRPKQSVTGPRERWNYYGIPMSVLKSEADLYDAPADLPTKLALHSSTLTPAEKYIIPSLAATKLSYDRLKLYGKKLIFKKEKEQ